MMKVITIDEWITGNYDDIAMIDLDLKDIATQNNFTLIPYIIDGLGNALGQSFRMDDVRQFALYNLIDPPENGTQTYIVSLVCEPEKMRKDTSDILTVLQVAPHHLKWSKADALHSASPLQIFPQP